MAAPERERTLDRPSGLSARLFMWIERALSGILVRVARLRRIFAILP